MLTRRQVIKGVAAFCAGTAGLGGYALAEPWRLNVTRYRLTPPRWPAGLAFKLAVLADFHICEPWMGVDRLRRIVARTNAIGADAVLLLGDYEAGYRLSKMSRKIERAEWAAVLAGLRAPLGIHAVMGNHDWWEDRAVQDRRAGPPPAQVALEAAGIPVYENRAVKLAKPAGHVWLAGLGDQWALWPTDRRWRGRTEIPYTGVHDLPRTLAQVTDEAPLILMAHEPDIFPEVPERVSLMISGHTHGGQVNVLGYTPIVPSRFGPRYVYGHIVEQGRNLIVSGGLGCSGVPVRFGVPPEIVVVELGAPAAA